MVYRKVDESDRVRLAEFASLFAQLEDTTAAPMDIGLQQLCRRLEELRRRKAGERN